MAKRVTIKEIAGVLGVSTATVSMVLNGKTDEIGQKTIDRVLKAAKQMQYSRNQVARSLVTQKSDTLAIVIPDIRNMFYSAIIKSISRVANNNGYSILLCDTDNDFDKEFEQLRILDNRLIDGILLASRNSTELLTHYDNARHLPIVILDEESELIKDYVYTVASDNFLSGYRAAKQLLELGHREFFFLTGVAGSTNSIRREQGIKHALEEYGVTIKPDSFVHADYKMNNAYEIVHQQSTINYTALIAFNDLMAYGAMKALREKQISVPREVSVVGFDTNTSQAMFDDISGYRLTSINQNEKLIGEVATNTLLASLQNQAAEPAKQLLTAEWNSGNTIGKPRKGR
ncbi:LacI family DNA-binding transcriptional regulator [Lacticaseibacillus nasuensis]|uniref:LacI family DNA-binding transcriptional regulator n=1 Tax=Lacticaseibacillus nasuensis TaxID=944671 RepID=UPI00224560E8|nr:LacI family DNA-binding transcriptional regulator [Lacticaseibacillus nasuensis]MCX2456029.1 LacI family transcriptional regulator [Lacticaseibacillus nasuensis]